jgi:osmotically-inducible protein OsmY
MMKAKILAAMLGIALAAPSAALFAQDRTTPTPPKSREPVRDTQEKSTAREVVDDTLITTKVKSALLAEKGVDSARISVETEKGRVMLSGEVKSPDQRQKAEGVARKVSGVKDVDNKLEVK